VSRQLTLPVNVGASSVGRASLARMIDELRETIERRLQELDGEADRLRAALEWVAIIRRNPTPWCLSSSVSGCSGRRGRRSSDASASPAASSGRLPVTVLAAAGCQHVFGDWARL